MQSRGLRRTCLGGCLHKDIKKQYIARNDKAIRAKVQAFTKGKHGGFCLIADVGHLEGLKEIGVHSTRVPVCVLPDRYLHNKGLDQGVEGGLLQRGEADSRCKMRSDMMEVEMTIQSSILTYHDDVTGTTMPTLTARLHNATAQRIWIVQGGYCSDTRCDKLNGKEGRHQAIQTALEDHGYRISTLPITLGGSGSHFYTTTDAFKQLGAGRNAMNTLISKLELLKHVIMCLHNILRG